MKIKHAIRTMIISDFYLNAGLSLFGPIFALFVSKQIPGATIAVIGFGAAITQIVKCVLEIPIAKYLDKNHGEFDDFYSLVAGNVFLVMTPFLYIFASKVGHIYAIQAVAGLSLALIVPPWNAIFSRHLDKSQESLEWAFESVSIGIATAGAAAIGGIIAEKFGFNTVFLIGGFLAAFGAIHQVKIFNDLRAKVPRGAVKPQPDGL
jgi:MFS family permease